MSKKILTLRPSDIEQLEDYVGSRVFADNWGISTALLNAKGIGKAEFNRDHIILDLSGLPEKEVVIRKGTFQGYRDIKSESHPLRIETEASFDGCGCQKLPQMEVEGEVRATECPNLIQVCGLKSRKNVNLNHNPRLTDISHVEAKTLSLKGCSNLKEVGEGVVCKELVLPMGVELDGLREFSGNERNVDSVVKWVREDGKVQKEISVQELREKLDRMAGKEGGTQLGGPPGGGFHTEWELGGNGGSTLGQDPAGSREEYVGDDAPEINGGNHL